MKGAALAAPNAWSVDVTQKGDYPMTEPGRPLLIRTMTRPEHPASPPGELPTTMVGPFAGREEAQAFLAETFDVAYQPLSGSHAWPVGHPMLWEEVEVSIEDGPGQPRRWQRDPGVRIPGHDKEPSTQLPRREG